MSIPLNFFDDPEEAPRPPDEVRITEVRVDPLPDGRRVVVTVKLTPFLQKPDFDVTILRDGNEERSLSVVGAMQPEVQLTMHLPAASTGSYVARVDLLRPRSADDASRALRGLRPGNADDASRALREGRVQHSETVAFKLVA